MKSILILALFSIQLALAQNDAFYNIYSPNGSSCYSITSNCTSYFSGTIQAPYIVTDNVLEMEAQITTLTSTVQQLQNQNAQLQLETAQLEAEVSSLTAAIDLINTNPYLVAQSFGCDVTCLKPNVSINSPGGASENCYTNLTSCGTNAFCDSQGQCKTARVIFTSNGTLTGNFGNSGNDFCQSQAYLNPSLQSKQFAAVYCGPDGNAIGTKTPFSSEDNIPVVNVAGGLIAGSAYQMLHSQYLISNLNMNQFGQPLPGNRYAWTGTSTNGVCSSYTCNKWTSSSNSGTGDVGNPRHITSGSAEYSWMTDNLQVCSSNLSLYCIEVD